MGFLDPKPLTVAAGNATYEPKGARATKVSVTVGKTSDCDFYTANYASDDLALKAAIDSLPVGYSGGGSILIKRGTYNFVNGASAAGRQNIHISGEGMSTILQWKNGNVFANATAGANYLITVGAYSSVTDLQLVGNSTYRCPVNGVNTYSGSGTNTLGGGISVYQGSRVWLDHIYIGGMAEDGVNMTGTASSAASHANRLSNLYIIGCGGYGFNNGQYTYDTIYTGVWIGSCKRGLYINDGGVGVVNCHIWGSEEYGVYVNGASVRFESCYIESNGFEGLIIAANQVTVSGCDIWQNGIQTSMAGASSGIRLTSARKCAIVGNNLRDNIGFHVSIGGSASSYNVITDNACSDSLAVNQVTGAQVSYANAAITAGSTTLTNTVDAPFKASHVGRSVSVAGMGASGATVRATIIGYTSASSVTIDVAATTTVTAGSMTIRHVLTAINDTTASGQNVIANNIVPYLESYSASVVTNALSENRNNIGWNPSTTIVGGTIVSGSISLDLRVGNLFLYTLGANSTASVFGTPHRGATIKVILTQDATGSRTITWPASFKFSGGSAPALTTTAGKADVFEFVYDGTNWRELHRSLNT